MREKRNNNVYLLHILEAVQKIEVYLSNHTQEDFNKESWDQDAVSRNLEIIGEAANNLDTLFRDEHSEVPWRKIINLRNIIVHDYADIDLEIVWNIITEYLPHVKTEILKLHEEVHSQCV